MKIIRAAPLFADLAKAAGQMRQRSAEATAMTV